MPGSTWVVVPAAGSGQRFGGPLAKQYLPLAGRTVLETALLVLLSHSRIAGVQLVLAADDLRWSQLPLAAESRIRVCVGGARRMDSVLAGLQALPASVAASDPVLVHDAARPLLSQPELDRLFSALDAGAAGALLALPVRDTVKRADARGLVEATVPREALWRALTPQAFARAELQSALLAALASGIEVTDEAQAIECFGRARIQLVEGEARNFKITTAADLELARLYLGAA